MKYKWLDEEQTQVVKYEDGKQPVTIPSNRFEASGVNEWLEQGNSIEPFETEEEAAIRELEEREEIRDTLESEAVLLYDGKLFFMTPRARKNMNESRGSLERGGTLNWPCYDPSTGEKSRYPITQVEFEKFEDALFEAIDSLHVQADTQEPINPWPLGVE